jgi:hypothetical protein
MAEPPFEEGGDQVIIADVFPGVALAAVGEPGTVAGVIDEEGAEDAESPTLFLATTVKVRAVPFSKPVNVAVRTFPTVTVRPVEDVTM